MKPGDRVTWKKRKSFGFKVMIGRIKSIDTGGVALVEIAHNGRYSGTVHIGINYLISLSN